MAKVSKSPPGRRRSDVVGKRRADVVVETHSRRDLLQRKQIAAHVLLACYLIGAALVGLGAVFAADLLGAGAQAGVDSTSSGDFTAIGALWIVLDLMVVGVLLAASSRLWKNISAHRVHHIRTFSFISFTVAIIALLVMAITQGAAVLNTVWSGIGAFFLVFFAIAALTSYAANRSMEEHF